jgi:hypothetical protein
MQRQAEQRAYTYGYSVGEGAGQDTTIASLYYSALTVFWAQIWQEGIIILILILIIRPL